MPDWLQPMFQPTLVGATIGAVLAGLGVLVTRVSVAVVLVVPVVRDTVDWWDERRDRRSRPALPAMTTSPAPPTVHGPPEPTRTPELTGRRETDSTQMALPLGEVTSSSPVRRVS